MTFPPSNIGCCRVSPMTCALDPASYQWKAPYSTPSVADILSIEALFKDDLKSPLTIEDNAKSSIPSLQTLFNTIVHENHTLRERVRQLEAKFDGSNACNDSNVIAELKRKDEEIARLKKKAREIVEQCQKWRNIAQTN